MKKKQVKRILKFIIKDTDICNKCYELGQVINACPCMNDKDCVKHFIELWEKKYMKGE